jgi:hypothetical protein
LANFESNPWMLSGAVGCFGFGTALPTGFFIIHVNLAAQGAVSSWDGFSI